MAKKRATKTAPTNIPFQTHRYAWITWQLPAN
ncbi:hypothetical protein DO73_4632 [Burkholderia pseudomallei]|nr:hypothetical protein DO73_4632 [Burkholderia pseudomallei]